MMAIFAFSIRVGPPAATTTFWLRTTPSTSSVSSIVPPIFLTTRISLRSTFEEVGVTSRETAATAIGAKVDEYCETIYSGISDSVDGWAIMTTYLRVQRGGGRTQKARFVAEIDWC